MQETWKRIITSHFLDNLPQEVLLLTKKVLILQLSKIIMVFPEGTVPGFFEDKLIINDTIYSVDTLHPLPVLYNWKENNK